MTKPLNEPQPIDIFIGSRVRERRQKLEWTLMDLGNKLGVSHQQIQKYEQGITRITAAVLFELSELFGVSINYFYEGYEDPDTEETLDKTISVVRKSPLRIILVEDDPSDEMLVREAILDADRPSYIHVLHNGRQLLDFLKNKTGSNRFPRPDIIFMNLTLPLLDGISVLKEIKRNRSLQDIPIIVLSNSVDKKDLIESYRSFASGYIKKTFDHKQFKSQISDSITYWSNICLPNM